MPAIEMVMCASCGHPQEAAERCVQCGAALPAPLRAGAPPHNQLSPPTPPAPLPPTSSLRLGETELRFRGDVLELQRRRGGLRSLAVAELTGFQISRRPLYEALIAAFLFFVLARVVHSPQLRLLLLLLDLVMVTGFFLYRRYRFAALTRANEVQVASMLVRRGSKEERRVREGLSALRAFLTLRGVPEGGR